MRRICFPLLLRMNSYDRQPISKILPHVIKRRSNSRIRQLSREYCLMKSPIGNSPIRCIYPVRWIAGCWSYRLFLGSIRISRLTTIPEVSPASPGLTAKIILFSIITKNRESITWKYRSNGTNFLSRPRLSLRSEEICSPRAAERRGGDFPRLRQCRPGQVIASNSRNALRLSARRFLNLHCHTSARES